ncbi:MAG: cobalt-precorrin-5B (C(1))-methyltransferase CbiD [Faecousia sp.]
MMERYMEKDGKRLRLGYTTGSCAAAAAKAAAWMLLTGQRKERIQIQTPKGIPLDLPVLDICVESDRVSCAIEKDGGDDPDVTKGMHITAEVSRTEESGIHIDGGQGVGRVTKPGLDQPVGNAAINSVPRQMIRENLEEVCRIADYRGGLAVVISAPGGDEIAKQTFNPRLGIEDGISILGTTGIVEPMSEQALVDTIRVELRQRKINGAQYVLLTPGNYGSDFIKESLLLDPARGVLVSNYIGDALDICRELGFRGILLVGHIGKLVKVAGGMFNTHSKYGDCRMDILTAQAACCGLTPAGAKEMLGCVTCDDGLRILQAQGIYEQTLEQLTERIRRLLDIRVGGALETGVILFSKVYGLLGKTPNADGLIEYIMEG